MKPRAGLFAAAVPVVLLLVAPPPSAAQTPPEVAPEMTAATLRQDWRAVANFAAAQPSLSSPERLLAAHAQLALNRSNEALAGFLSFTEEEPLRQWKDWTAKLISEHPSNPVACYLHGDALARLREWPAAMEAFDAGLKLDPANAMLLHARGVSHAANWQLDRALVDLTMATRSKPDFAEAYASLGSTWVQRQSGGTGALRAFNKALELSRDSAVALYSRGGVRMAQGDLQSARVDFDRAIEIAGPLAPAITAKLADVIESFRRQQEREIELALNRGENPGVFIQRGIEQLQREGPGGSRGALDTLMSAGARFPEQRQQITQAISSVAGSDPAMRQQIAAGLDRRQTLETHMELLTDAVGRAVAPISPGYAAAIGTRNVLKAATASTITSPSDSFRRTFDVKYYSDAGQTFSGLGKALSAYSKIVDSRFSAAPRFGGRAFGLTGAAFQDYSAFRAGRLSLENSKTVDQSAKIFGAAAERMAKDGKWAPEFRVAPGAVDIGLAVKSQLARRSLIPNESERTSWGAAVHGLATADFKSRVPLPGLIGTSSLQGWGSGLAVTSVMPEIFNFTASRFDRGFAAPLSIREVEYGLDAFAKGTAYYATFVGTVGNAAAASGVAELVGIAADQGRRNTQGWFDYWSNGDVRVRMVDQYSDYVQSSAARGIFANPPDRGSFRQAGFTDAQISQLSNMRTPPRPYSTSVRIVTQPPRIPVVDARQDPRAPRDQEVLPGRRDLLPPCPPTSAACGGGPPPLGGGGNDLPPGGGGGGARLGTGRIGGVMLNSAAQVSNASASPSAITPVPSAADRVSVRPAQTREFLNGLQRSVGHDAKPGGFRTGSELPFWQDGEWPFTPWYGLAYIISESPTRTESAEKQQ